MLPRTISNHSVNRPDGTVVNDQRQPAGSRNASPKILEAARAIAAREGAGKITIEAVAKEAGLSKGGVLYNFPTKRALLSGLLDQMLAAHRELLANVPEGHPGRTLRGHLETFLQSQDVDDDLSMAILAAAASDPRLLDPLRTELTDDLERILTDAKGSRDGRVLLRRLHLSPIKNGGLPRELGQSMSYVNLVRLVDFHCQIDLCTNMQAKYSRSEVAQCLTLAVMTTPAQNARELSAREEAPVTEPF